MNLNVLTCFAPILSCLPSFKRRQLQCSRHLLAVIIATGVFYYTIESMVPQLQPSWTSGIKIKTEFNNNILWHILNCLVCICAATKNSNKGRSDQFRFSQNVRSLTLGIKLIKELLGLRLGRSDQIVTKQSTKQKWVKCIFSTLLIWQARFHRLPKFICLSYSSIACKRGLLRIWSSNNSSPLLPIKFWWISDQHRTPLCIMYVPAVCCQIALGNRELYLW